MNKNEFKEKYNTDVKDMFNGKLNDFIKQGLIKENESNIVLTRKGLDLSNIVFVELI